MHRSHHNSQTPLGESTQRRSPGQVGTGSKTNPPNQAAAPRIPCSEPAFTSCSPFSLGWGAHSPPPSPSVWGAQAHRQG